MHKFLTESQAWRVIAAAFAEPKPRKRMYSVSWTTSEQFDYEEKELSVTGLCFAVSKLREKDQITGETEEAMWDRVDRAMRDCNVTSGYIFTKYDPKNGWAINDKGEKARAARSMVALLFALEAKEGVY